MTRKFMLTAFVGAFLTTATAQTFHNAIGSTSAFLNDFCTDAIPTSDGGYLFVGGNPDYGNGDMYVIKTTSSGTISWQKYYGTASDAEGANCVAELSDGGFIIGGFTMPFPTGTSTATLVKITSAGVVSWTKKLNSGTAINDVCAHSDGTFAVTGSYTTDVLAIKMTNTGTLTWQRIYNLTTSGGGEGGNSIIRNSDGTYMIAGLVKASSDVEKVLIMKVSALGIVSWANSYQCYSPVYIAPNWYFGSHIAESIIATSDGGYIVAGHASDAIVDQQHYIIKTNSSGTYSWSQLYGTTGTHYQGTDIIATSDGGYLSSDRAEALIKMNSSGMLSWTKKYYGVIEEVFESGTDFVFGGNTNAFNGPKDDVYMVKTDSNGDCCADMSNSLTSFTHTTTTTSLTSSTTSPITFSTFTIVSNNVTATLLSECPCPVDAGSNKMNTHSDACCVPANYCSPVTIGTASSGYTYSWSPPTGLSSTSAAQPTASPCATTIYTLAVSDASCITNSDQVVVTTAHIICCGPKSAEQDLNGGAVPVTIYPNPSNGSFTIMLGEVADPESPVEIKVTDLLGKEVHYQKGAAGITNYTVDITGESKGIYLVTIIIGDTVTTEKIELE